MTNTLHRQGSWISAGTIRSSSAAKGSTVRIGRENPGVHADLLKHRPVNMGTWLGSCIRRSENGRADRQTGDGRSPPLHGPGEPGPRPRRSDPGRFGAPRQHQRPDGRGAGMLPKGGISATAPSIPGIWGQGPAARTGDSEFNTMCGTAWFHGLIRKMIEQVRLRRLTPKRAARMMAKCCMCGAFNPVRAEALLQKMLTEGWLHAPKR